MRLKSRDQSPPNGYLFFQPQTGWEMPHWLSFNAAVEAIIAHRKANPRFDLPIDIITVERELEDYTCARLSSMKGGSGYMLDTAGEPPPPKSPARPSLIANAVAGIKRSHAGIKIVLDWLGEGMEPVANGISSSRAITCVDCPQNKPPNTLQKLYSRTIEGMALLADFKAITPLDEKLFSCQACDCDLRFKVHTPMKHILKYTTDEIKARLDARCWILKI